MLAPAQIFLLTSCVLREVLSLIRTLDVSKANGPYSLSSRMLKAVAPSRTPSITLTVLVTSIWLYPTRLEAIPHYPYPPKCL